MHFCRLFKMHFFEDFRWTTAFLVGLLIFNVSRIMFAEKARLFSHEQYSIAWLVKFSRRFYLCLMTQKTLHLLKRQKETFLFLKIILLLMGILEIKCSTKLSQDTALAPGWKSSNAAAKLWQDFMQYFEAFLYFKLLQQVLKTTFITMVFK